MPTNIGHYEILSELATSPTGSVYKANDSESGQTLALKTILLSAFGEHAAALEQALEKEARSLSAVKNPNLTCVSNPQVIDGQFCATMEYVQGNSIATMFARGEGFSIWDLLDIGRQLCCGIDYAAMHEVVHYSLEPSKIMCGWDGTVRILSFGVSSVGNFVQHASEGISSILYYMSPEQLGGEAADRRSNLFSLGAIFYEMVTEKKAFDGGDLESLRQNILESAPVPPIQLNAKIHPLLSDLIMKTLAKDPAHRYQTGRSLLDDLENCKEVRPAPKKVPAAPSKQPVSANLNATRIAGVPPGRPQPPSSTPQQPAAAPRPMPGGGVAKAPAAVRPVMAKPGLAQPASRLATPKSAAAAAGVGAGASTSNNVPATSASEELEISPTAEQEPSAHMSLATDEPQVENFEAPPSHSGPRIAVDPLMAEGGPAPSTGTSFSDITELPPLKEVYVAPPPPPPAEEVAEVAPTPVATVSRTMPKKPEKPKIQPRQLGSKAIKEVKNVPPKLMMYSLIAAGAVILVIAIGIRIYLHTQDSDDDAGASRPAPATAVTEQPVAPAQPQAAQPDPAAPSAQEVVSPQAEAQPTEVPETSAPVEEPVRHARGHAPRRKAAPAAAIPGQLTVDSTPQGAEVRVDGQGDPTWVTPISLTNLQPGQHSITVSKAGYTTDSRSVEVSSGGHASTTVRLAQSLATLVVKSNPPGAEIYVDTRNIGTKTPAQVSLGKGPHTVLVRMSGYLDETMNAQFALGQTVNFAPTLRPSGNVDSIRTVGKMSKLFGKAGQNGQGMIIIHTQPKGAQVAINQHMLDKDSPVEILVDPGNYQIDITLSGYAPVHTVVTAEQGGKAVVNEELQRQ